MKNQRCLGEQPSIGEKCVQIQLSRYPKQVVSLTPLSTGRVPAARWENILTAGY